MSDQLQLRGGTTANHASFTGAVREVTVDTTKYTAVVHDGVTPGGHPLLREDLSNLGAGSLGTLLAPGLILFFAANTPPTGWLKANGAAVSRATYASLFAAIGTTFGAGDGSTTFNLPDLRGEFLRGWDDSRGIDTGRVFGSAQADSFKAHNHGLDTALPAYFANRGLTTGAYTFAQDSSSITVTQYTGGSETRPINIALLAIIKY